MTIPLDQYPGHPAAFREFASDQFIVFNDWLPAIMEELWSTGPTDARFAPGAELYPPV